MKTFETICYDPNWGYRKSEETFEKDMKIYDVYDVVDKSDHTISLTEEEFETINLPEECVKEADVYMKIYVKDRNDLD